MNEDKKIQKETHHPNHKIKTSNLFDQTMDLIEFKSSSSDMSTTSVKSEENSPKGEGNGPQVFNNINDFLNSKMKSMGDQNNKFGIMFFEKTNIKKDKTKDISQTQDLSKNEERNPTTSPLSLSTDSVLDRKLVESKSIEEGGSGRVVFNEEVFERDKLKDAFHFHYKSTNEISRETRDITEEYNEKQTSINNLPSLTNEIHSAKPTETRKVESGRVALTIDDFLNKKKDTQNNDNTPLCFTKENALDKSSSLEELIKPTKSYNTPSIFDFLAMKKNNSNSFFETSGGSPRSSQHSPADNKDSKKYFGDNESGGVVKEAIFDKERGFGENSEKKILSQDESSKRARLLKSLQTRASKNDIFKFLKKCQKKPAPPLVTEESKVHPDLEFPVTVSEHLKVGKPANDGPIIEPAHEICELSKPPNSSALSEQINEDYESKLVPVESTVVSEEKNTTQVSVGDLTDRTPEVKFTVINDENDEQNLVTNRSSYNIIESIERPDNHQLPLKEGGVKRSDKIQTQTLPISKLTIDQPSLQPVLKIKAGKYLRSTSETALNVSPQKGKSFSLSHSTINDKGSPTINKSTVMFSSSLPTYSIKSSAIEKNLIATNPAVNINNPACKTDVLNRNISNNIRLNKIPSQVHLKKTVNPKSLLFGHSLASFYTNSPATRDPIKFSEGYFKNEIKEGTGNKNLGLLYNKKINFSPKLEDILNENRNKSILNNDNDRTTEDIHNIKQNGVIKKDTSLLLIKFFTESLNNSIKPSISSSKLHSEFVELHVNEDFKFPFDLFISLKSGTFIQTSTETKTHPSKETGFLKTQMNTLVDLIIFFMNQLNDIKTSSLFALQVSKYVEHKSIEDTVFLLFMFYKRYNINIFSFFTEHLLKDELYTSILVFEGVNLHKKECVDNFIYSLNLTNSVSSMGEMEIFNNKKIHKDCESGLCDFLEWKYTLMGNYEEFLKMKNGGSMFSSLFKSFSSVIVGVSPDEANGQSVPVDSKENQACGASKGYHENIKHKTVQIPTIKGDISTESKKKEDVIVQDTQTTVVEALQDVKTKESVITPHTEESDKKLEIQIKKSPQKQGFFSSLTNLIFGKSSEDKNIISSDEKFSFFSSNSKPGQTFKVKPQEGHFVYDKNKDEWVSTKKIDRKKKHEEYMKNLRKDKKSTPAPAPSPPKGPLLQSTNNQPVVSVHKYPKKTNTFSTPIKKINIPSMGKLRPLIKREDDFFTTVDKPKPLETTKTSEFKDLTAEKNTEEAVDIEKTNNEKASDLEAEKI
ncbi:hypothetical protein CDIK_1033 [Cucumispora dikerogammari]|nr:hypothetical protein CDIK_1033 [Cucumispora dikerogammari]